MPECSAWAAVRQGRSWVRRDYGCRNCAAWPVRMEIDAHGEVGSVITRAEWESSRLVGGHLRGGPGIRQAGEMVTRLQATAPFTPVMSHFGTLTEALLNLVRDGAAGELRQRTFHDEVHQHDACLFVGVVDGRRDAGLCRGA